MLSGLLRIDKPAGPTSHDLVAQVRRAAGQRRVGHGGALDPPATGLLVVLLGKATRLQQAVMGGDKVYTFDLVLGLATDTLDHAGRPQAVVPVPDLDSGVVAAAAGSLVGLIELEPPMVSALHHQGRRLYELARQGIEVERKPRPTRIHALDVEGDPWRDEDGHLRVPLRILCGSGTYVRSVGEELARRLGLPGCIDRLRRVRSGHLEVVGALDAWALERGREAVLEALEPMEVALGGMPRVELGRTEARAFVHGNPVPTEDLGPGERSVFAEGQLLGLGEVREGLLRPTVVLAEGTVFDG